MSTTKAVADSVEGILMEESFLNSMTYYGIAKRKPEEYIFK